MRGLNAEAQRVYVAHANGQIAWSSDGAHWAPIALPPFPVDAVAPNANVDRVRLAGGNVPAHAVVYVLPAGPRLWRIDGDVAAIVRGLPRDLFDVGAGTGPFAMAIASHPSAAYPDILAVGGGSFAPHVGPRQAALYVGQLVAEVDGTFTFPNAAVAQGDPPAEWTGGGLPPGVHAIRWYEEQPLPPAVRMWIAGDGGVFRSDAASDPPTSFLARNTGLAIVDATSFAQSGEGGVMLVGTRTNGVLARRAGQTWEIVLPGRAGDVAIDPRDARKMYAQSSGARWLMSTSLTQEACPPTRARTRTQRLENVLCSHR